MGLDIAYDKDARPLKADEVPAVGDRALVVGQTGQGKTEFVMWLLERLTSSPVVIYDTKHEQKLNRLPRSRVVYSHAAMLEALNDPAADYVVYRCEADLVADPDALDALLWYHFHHLRGVDLYIDELYSFTSNGRARRGLMTLLTQGRSHGFTTIMGVQRPTMISLFPLTESQHLYIFFLAYESDRDRVGEVVPNFEDEGIPPEFHFFYYRQGSRTQARLVAPILLDKASKKDYKPTHDDAVQQTDVDPGTAHHWL